MMQEHPELGWVILVAPAMMVMALILDRRQRSKRVSTGATLPRWLQGAVLWWHLMVMALIVHWRQHSKRVSGGCTF
jgi:hypothetical protein